MGTLWARMGHPKLMTGANLAFPEYRKIIVDQFAKAGEIGADGVHVDKMFPAPLDHNPIRPWAPTRPPGKRAILLTKEVMAACRRHNPDWAMSFECNWDRMLEFGGATWWVGNQRSTRLVFPENAETLVISSPTTTSASTTRFATDMRSCSRRPISADPSVGLPGKAWPTTSGRSSGFGIA